MKIIHGQNLVKELRKLSDNVTERLWIAVPYIGSPTTVRRILGKEWFDRPSVNVKLLTDTSEITCVDAKTLQHFHDRGQVKSLAGIHAKIYIVDDSCLVTSANLTSTAFSKRHEIGILCSSKQAKQLVEIFNDWWRKSIDVKPDQIKKIFAKEGSSKEEKGVSLPTIFSLPDDPGFFPKNLAKRFLNYDRLVADYEDFAKKYSTVQRIWKGKPLFFEIDGLFNYLYHIAPKVPSFRYLKMKPRNLSHTQQMSEIKKWAASYKEWNKSRRKEFGDDIEWRLDSSRKLQRLLSPRKVLTLNKSELEEAFHCLNSLNVYQINLKKILNNNSVSKIRNALNELVNGDGQLAARMDFCNGIKSLGTSSMNEILGFTSPHKYPLINRNSNAGLRFFGYHIKVYN